MSGCTFDSETAHGRAVKILSAREVGHGANVLVATAREADEDRLILAHGLGQLHGIGHGVAGFQCGDDALGAAQIVKGVQRFGIRDAHVLRALDLLQPGVLWAHAGVVQARADRMGLGDLAVFILQDESAVAVQHARATFLQRSRVLAGLQTFASSFHAKQLGVLKRDVGVEDAHGIAAAAHAGDHSIGLLFGAQKFGHLRQALIADDLLEVAHHHGIGMGAGHGTDDVEGVIHVGHPVTHGFVERILEGLGAGLHGHHGGTQQLHSVDVGALAFHVLGTHVDDAFQAVARADGGRGYAMLAGTGLGNDAGLAHALGEHGLADHVIDFVRAGVVQVFALEVDLRASHLTRHAVCVINGRGTAYVVRQFGLEFCDELGVVLILGIGLTQLGEGVGQGFAGEAAAVAAEVAKGVGILVFKHVSVCKIWASAARTAAMKQ